MSFSKVTLATYLRTELKPEITTVSGDSSTITSTPSACSKALIFLPSLPIMRPFISSLGIVTVVVVVSLETSALTRSMACDTMSRAFFSASSRASSTILRVRPIISSLTCRSVCSKSTVLASAVGQKFFANLLELFFLLFQGEPLFIHVRRFGVDIVFLFLQTRFDAQNLLADFRFLFLGLFGYFYGLVFGGEDYFFFFLPNLVKEFFSAVFRGIDFGFDLNLAYQVTDRRASHEGDRSEQKKTVHVNECSL